MTQACFWLLWTEFRRQWTITALIIPVFFLAISSLVVFIPTPNLMEFNVADKAFQILNSLLAIASAFFCVGLVQNDVKDGWLRTLLVRAIRREEYLLAKSLSALASIWATMVLSVGLPMIVGLVLTKLPVTFEFGQVFGLFALFVCVSLLHVSILTFFSCWLPGVVNVVALMAWYTVSTLLHAYATFILWDSPWAAYADQFLFPSGFFDAVDAVHNSTHTPYTEVLWGMAALAFFSSLAFWSINRIQVDKGSE